MHRTSFVGREMLTRRAMFYKSAAFCTVFQGIDSSFSAEKEQQQQPSPRFIADAWYAHTAFLVLLGAQDRLVATAARPETTPWMFHFFPQFRKLARLQPRALNAEALLSLKTDLLFLPETEIGQSTVFRQQGLRAVALGFSDMDGLLHCVRETASLINTPLAFRRARAYERALRHALTQCVPSPHGPRLLHMASLKPLKVDGRQTIIDQWIRAAGGQNAASLSGNHREVTAEQIVMWNPDLIIIPASAPEHDFFQSHPILSRLRAVQNHRVYRNPAGLFLWDRYGPELLLQLDWTKQIVTAGHSDEGAMMDRIVAFYRDFYGLHVSNWEAGRMLAALPPSPS